MDKKTLTALGLCFLIYLGWYHFFMIPQIEHPRKIQPSSVTKQHEVQPIQEFQKKEENRRIEKPYHLHLKHAEILLANPGDIHDWKLKNYQTNQDQNSSSIHLKAFTNQDYQVQLAFDIQDYLYLNSISGEFSRTQNQVNWTYEDSNIVLKKNWHIPEQPHHQHYLNFTVNAQFKTKIPRYAFLSLSAQNMNSDEGQWIYWKNQSVERISIGKKIEQKALGYPLRYIGITNRYFVFALIAQSSFVPSGLIQPIHPSGGRLSLAYSIPGNSIQIPLRVYFGPKELETLRLVEPSLDYAVDFGWFTFFAYPLLRLLKWLYQFVQNYGVAIILLTLFLKLLTFPLTYKGMKSMKNVAKIQPQLEKLRAKYKDDKMQLNQEILMLMKNQGYNPMAGCLPILIQMPIFIALYRVLYNSIELYHAPFMLWIQDLSSKDPYYVTPIILSILMYIQQKLTPQTTTDPAQAKIMQFMPLIFGLFMLTLPAGLTLYMLTNTLASILQQMILNRKLEAYAQR